jgi:hypothetical protein
MPPWRFVNGAKLRIPISEGRPSQEIAMTNPGNQMLTAAVALLALASPVAHGLDASGATRYAAVDPSAFRQYAAPADKTATASGGKRQIQRKPKAAKTKILAGLHNFRTPAQRALERINRPNNNCQPAERACPAVFRDGLGSNSQARRYASPEPANDAKGERQDADVPLGTQPGLTRAYSEVPGLVPGRESSYKLSLNLPLGRFENVLLQANVRKNAFNMQNSSDSTLRADWSVRF